jgi:hypothetical protein
LQAAERACLLIVKIVTAQANLLNPTLKPALTERLATFAIFAG